jgi:hypothetical protein
VPSVLPYYEPSSFYNYPGAFKYIINGERERERERGMVIDRE